MSEISCPKTEVPKKYVFLSIVEKFLAKQNYKKRRSQTYALASLKSFYRTTVIKISRF